MMAHFTMQWGDGVSNNQKPHPPPNKNTALSHSAFFSGSLEATNCTACIKELGGTREKYLSKKMTTKLTVNDFSSWRLPGTGYLWIASFEMTFRFWYHIF